VLFHRVERVLVTFTTVTMPVLLVMCRVLPMIGVHIDATIVTLAIAINVALSVVDLIVWNSFYAPIGSWMLPGGRYIR
jgi:hypothetical protein